MDSTRTFTRVPVHIEAWVRDGTGTEARGIIRDLSLNGICMTSETIIQEGASCDIRFFLGTGAQPIPIDATGTVVRSVEGSLALRIDEVDPDGHEHFNNLVLYNAPDAAAFEREADEHADEQPVIQPLRSE